MPDQRHICLLTYMVAVAIPVSLSFNIDTRDPKVYTGERQDFFGYKVLQYESDTNKGLIISAPLKLNGSGAVCNNHTCFSPQDISIKNQTIPIKRLGLALAADSGSHFTVCSPIVAHECYLNSYLSSICYNITHNLTQVSNSTPSFQECRDKDVNLVFLFDGSESMTENEFNKNKDFMVDIIDKHKNSSFKFAAVQFSTNCRKVFDFNDYQAGTALDKLQKEPHMRGLTNTHRALKFVLENILENPDAGAAANATKVLVIITDGDPSDSDKTGITKQYHDKNIICFVIAVKGAKLHKFSSIASKPTGDHAFKIEDYDGLTGTLGNLKKTIFEKEGTKTFLAEEMTIEMAQSGFSAVIYKNSLVLGSVGSNRWRGSIEVMTSGGTSTQIKDSEMQIESYMGYSVSVGEKDKNVLYFSGAPRFEHTGQVVIFNNTWNVTQRLKGDQIGSYFGAELCSVDIDLDGNTDFLLVGAPLFYHSQEKREGQIYVYMLTKELDLKSVQKVTVASMGRFGTTISSIADLNGDGLRDVAVGAPLEDKNRGAVYIYLGDKQGGIHNTFSQRITGQDCKLQLSFFGQAIVGNIDMGDDDLPDIVIGSKGTVVVLRSRPVLIVTPQMSFQPKEIKLDEIECPINPNKVSPINITVCFKTVEATKSKGGTTSTGIHISYTLVIDPNRPTPRGSFNRTQDKARSISSNYNLRVQDNPCFNYSIYMLKCIENEPSPISIKLNFTQTDSDNANTVLNVNNTNIPSGVDIPFQRLCQKKDECIANLVVDFNFMNSTLLVAEEGYFIVSVKLSNRGEKSYNTSLTMHYPEGLSFSKMELKEATRPTVHSCYDQEAVLNTTVCGISLPVFRTNSSATFITFFRIMTSANDDEYPWDDRISMTITGNSNNANATNLSSMTKNIPVQFEIKMAVTVKEDTVTYLNFTSEDSTPKNLEIIYEIANLGWKAFPVDVSVGFPTNLDHNFEIKNYNVSVDKTHTECTDTSASCISEHHIKVMKCNMLTLKKESSIKIKLSGQVQFKDLKKHAENMAFLKRYTGDGAEVSFQSFVQVSYNTTRYVLNTHKQENEGLTRKRSNDMCPSKDNSQTVKWAKVRVEFIIPMDRKLIILTGVGLGLLLLILLTIIMCKMGCFRRKTLPTNEEDEVEFPAGTSKAPIESTPDAAAPEKNTLLQNNEANGSSPDPDA